MQRIALALTLALTSFLALAPAPARADDSKEPERKLVLWKVTHPDLEATSYLFGTIHVPDKRVLALPKPVEEAFAASDALYCELALEPSLQMAATPLLMLPEGETLEGHIGKELLERAGKILAKRGLPLQPFQALKPWAFISQLQQLDFLMELQMGKLPLDSMLYQRAKKEGKTVGGLERLEDQLGVFDSISAEGQKKMVASGLDEIELAAKEKRKVAEPIIAAYLKGDIETILAKSEKEAEADEESKKFLKMLLYDRNVNMTKEIEALLTKSPKAAHFFAVGAAHYPGEKGIVALLEAKGYTVERVAAAK